MSDAVLYEKQDGIARITFNRPAAMNAMTFAMYGRLHELCDEIEQDPGVKVVVLAGAGGRAFVAGTDIAEFSSFNDPDDGVRYEERIERVVGRLESLARPTIAQVEGVAAGGGCMLALVCDLRIGTPAARFGAPIARTLGNCLSVENVARLMDLIGPARVKELLYTGRLVGPEEALQIGLLNEVAAPEQIGERVAAVARQLAANAPLTIRATKAAVYRIQAARRQAEGSDLYRLCYNSQDFRQAVAAFLARRPPRWRGV